VREGGRERARGAGGREGGREGGTSYVRGPAVSARTLECVRLDRQCPGGRSHGSAQMHLGFVRMDGSVRADGFLPARMRKNFFTGNCASARLIRTNGVVPTSSADGWMKWTSGW
jgi:hypothetical protein